MEPTGWRPRRLARFVRQRTRLWLLLLPLIALGIAVHELAHAAVVLAQGGAVLELSVVPAITNGVLSLGRTVHTAVPHPALVSIAPTLLWVIAALVALALLPRMRRRRTAELVLFAAVILPMVDLSLAFAGLFLGVPGADLAVLAGHELFAGVLMAILLPGLGALAWERLSRICPRALSSTDFAAALVMLLALPWLVMATA